MLLCESPHVELGGHPGDPRDKLCVRHLGVTVVIARQDLHPGDCGVWVLIGTDRSRPVDVVVHGEQVDWDTKAEVAR